MLDKMKQAKQLFDMQKKAKNVQKELRDTEIEAKSPDGAVTVVFNGELKLVELNIDHDYMSNHSVSDLERGLKTTITEALSKSQAVAAEKTREIMKELNINLPGF
jgi:DNA-binding YbaB/EbfC family protein